MGNCSLFKGTVGIFRIFALVFGLVVLALTSYAFTGGACIIDSSLFRVLLAIAIITFIISLMWAVFFILGVIVDSDITKKTDMVYHILGGLLLIIGGIIWIIAFFDRPDQYFCSGGQKALSVIIGIFGIVDGCVFLTVAFFIWKS